MAEKSEHEQSTTGHEVASSPVQFDEAVTADWRVQAAIKDRWHSIKANPKIIFIALFAS